MSASLRHEEDSWQRDRPLLICYAPLGDPACPEDLLEIYARAGADIVEVGVPTLDPYLDGATIADSMRRILAEPDGMSRIPRLIVAGADVLAKRMRIVLMGYTDMPFRAYDDAARRRLIHGILMVGGGADDPPGLDAWLSEHQLPRMGFVDFSLSAQSIERARHAKGYVMLQATDGPTGARPSLDRDNREKIAELRRARIDLPIVLGFGISTAAQAAEAIEWGADGVVVGSACIDAARRGTASLRDLVTSLRESIDHAANTADAG